MRLDRLLTQYIFGPLKAISPGKSGLEIPILMYHSIADDVDENMHPYYRTVTKPATFEKQIRFLSESGYVALTLSEAVQLLRGESDECLSVSGTYGWTELPHLVVITFDDGFRDFYTTAFPILEKFNFKATVFLTSGFIDKTFLTGRDCLRIDEIKELARKGVEFGSHTVSHPHLSSVSTDQIVHELAFSKSIIENITGIKVTLFSYPYRFPEENTIFTEKLGHVLSEQGYIAGVTTVIGVSKSSDNLLFLKRLPINDCDDNQFLQAKLEGSYDWLYKVQAMYKKLRAASQSLIKSKFY